MEIQADTAEQAQQEIAKRTEALVNFLRSRNVEQLQTAGIRLAPRYNILDEEFIFIGYVGLNTVSFRVDTERAGDIIDEAVRIGATRINGVGFMAEESEIEIAKQQVLAKATQNARDRANTVLNALNLSPQEIVKIQIGRVTVSDLTQRNGLGIINFGTDDNAISQLPQSPVIGGEQTVSASVTLHIRY